MKSIVPNSFIGYSDNHEFARPTICRRRGRTRAVRARGLRLQRQPADAERSDPQARGGAGRPDFRTRWAGGPPHRARRDDRRPCAPRCRRGRRPQGRRGRLARSARRADPARHHCDGGALSRALAAAGHELGWVVSAPLPRATCRARRSGSSRTSPATFCPCSPTESSTPRSSRPIRPASGWRRPRSTTSRFA